uniref:Uncharacterized protein n=1 Tax=Chenopodium quinoa TaxID=63459 RepID=A0A803KX37_CHEQI
MSSTEGSPSSVGTPLAEDDNEEGFLEKEDMPQPKQKRKATKQRSDILDHFTKYTEHGQGIYTAVKYVNAFERYDDEDPHYNDDLWDVDGYGKGLGKPMSDD